MVPASARKVGFLHVPKTGGASLSASLYAAFGLEPTFVTEVVHRNSAVPPRNPARTIVRGSVAYVLARNMPFLAGHSTFSDLASLKRDFVFTLLRDPRERVVSLFTYTQRRANSERTLGVHPKLRRFAGTGFREFMAEPQTCNRIASLLLGDLRGYADISSIEDRQRPPRRLLDFIDEGLRRFDVVYACSNQELLDDLHQRGVIPVSREVTKNVSEGTFSFGTLDSSAEFLDLLNQATWLDQLVYQRAAELFPTTVRKPQVSDAQLLERMEKRFGVSFPP